MRRVHRRRASAMDFNDRESGDGAPRKDRQGGGSPMQKAEKIAAVIPIDPRERGADRKTVSRRHIINRLNFINFQDGVITVRFRHRTRAQQFRFEAKPRPCIGESLDCRWVSPEAVLHHLDDCVFSDVCIEAPHRLTRFVPELVEINEAGLRFRLPEKGTEIDEKGALDRPCHGIRAQVIQHGAHFTGELARFNATRFQVSLTAQPPQTFQWLQTESPVLVIFSSGEETLYTGECTIVEHRTQGLDGTFILAPTAERLRRFDNREFRSERRRLVPSPHLLFRHPLTGALVQRNVLDISGTGFCVEELPAESTLPAGLILPEVELNFAGIFRFSCQAQVVYRSPRSPEKSRVGRSVHCGLAILDIRIEDHTKLLAMLNRADNRNCYICNQVDLDALWDFFFETGFIYPQKYAFLRENKDRIKRTYERLYNRPSTIARHFTYQEGTRILGHIAMLRFYQSAWMIHHHAGNTTASARAGLEVLRQIGHFGYDCHRLHAIHMDYQICYFRPENKFPARVFGRIARNIDNPKGCSIDGFAYYHYHKERPDHRSLPDGWTLEETGAEDLEALACFYGERSGGLMIEALDLTPEKLDLSSLSSEYRRLGFRRERHIFSLKKNHRVRALAVANLSNVGLNLSDLTSAINILLIEPEAITRQVIHRTLYNVAELYNFAEIPVLLYPSECAEPMHLQTEKQYNLWIMNIRFSDHYFKHLNRMLRFVS